MSPEAREKVRDRQGMNLSQSTVNVLRQIEGDGGKDAIFATALLKAAGFGMEENA